MNTPICDFLERYRDNGQLRLHMPGHKGFGSIGIEALDITEVEGADVLYSAKGIIKESMDNASRLFGTQRTLYSTEGSSLSIKAMLYLAMLTRGERKPLIAAGRNAHKVFMYGCALLDIEIDWLWGEGLLSCEITPEALELYLCHNDPVAVYITSPDYLGNMADIKGIAEVCHRHGVMLLVDNAHGAYLKFLPKSKHPIDLGADICCDSAHKTLPCLTGAGYLHISNNVNGDICGMADEAMSLFASTSPSYLIMYSLDMCNAYLESELSQRLASVIPQICELKQNLFTVGDEPMKLTLEAKKYGYSGCELSDIFTKQGIVCEFADPDYLVMMLPADTEALISVISVLVSVDRRIPITDTAPELKPLEVAMSPRAAIMSKSELVNVDDALWRILAAPSVSCPPAVPIAVCGEIINKNTIELFKYYGIEKVRVI